MSSVELKSNLHKLIDDIQNTELLKALYSILKESDIANEGSLWQSLSQSQKSEVLEAYKESENLKNLTPNSEVFKKFK